MTRQLVLALCVACAPAATAHAQQQPSANADIRQIRGNLYEVIAGSQVTVFYVAPDGILLVDPLNTPMALRLRMEFAARYPGRPVRYVVYSHHHFDRIEGAAVFQGAQVVAHNEFDEELAEDRRVLPPYVRITDANLNRVFDPSEIGGSPDAALVLSKDRNADGAVTAGELLTQIRSARTMYSGRMTLRLGATGIELVHPGPAFARDMTVVFFPDERIVFAADGPSVLDTPFSFGPFRPRDVYEWIHAIAPLDFDTLLFGDGRTIARAELVALGDYLDAIRAEAAAAYERGAPITALQASPARPADASSPHVSGRATQLAAVYRTVRLMKVQLSGAAATNYDRPDGSHCSGYTTCAVGGAVPAVSGGLAFLFGKGLGVVAELTFERQSWNTRTRPLYEEEIALRQSRGSLLLRYGPPRASRVSYAALAGLSTIAGDVRGMNHVHGALLRTGGGRHTIQMTDTRLGFTAGVDLAAGGRIGLIVPLRVTYTSSVPQYWPSRVNVRAAVGVTARVMRHVD